MKNLNSKEIMTAVNGGRCVPLTKILKCEPCELTLFSENGYKCGENEHLPKSLLKYSRETGNYSTALFKEPGNEYYDLYIYCKDLEQPYNCTRY